MREIVFLVFAFFGVSFASKCYQCDSGSEMCMMLNADHADEYKDNIQQCPEHNPCVIQLIDDVKYRGCGPCYAGSEGDTCWSCYDDYCLPEWVEESHAGDGDGWVQVSSATSITSFLVNVAMTMAFAFAMRL